MDTDRPHLTDSPHPVAAGHVQLESGIVNVDLDGGSSVERIVLFDQMYKVGLYSGVDLQLLYAHAAFSSSFRSLPVAPLVRAKVVLFEEEGVVPATTLVPFSTLPRKGADQLETGAWLFLGWDLSSSLSLEVNVGAFVFHAGDQYRPGGTLASALTVALCEPVLWFGELESVIRDLNDQSELRFGTGLLFQLTEDVQLDAGAYVGLAGATPAATPYLGLSLRI